MLLAGYSKPEPLSADEVISLFSGKTVEGEHQVKDFSFKSYYDPSGVFTSIRNGELSPLIGYWRVRESGEMCIRWDAEEEELCRHKVLHSFGRYAKVLSKSDGKRIPVVHYRSFVSGRAHEFR